MTVVGALVSLAAFLAGSVAGGRLAVRAMPRGRPWLTPAMACEAGLLLAALVAAASLGVTATSDSRLAVIALLAAAMGSASPRRARSRSLTRRPPS